MKRIEKKVRVCVRQIKRFLFIVKLFTVLYLYWLKKCLQYRTLCIHCHKRNASRKAHKLLFQGFTSRYKKVKHILFHKTEECIHICICTLLTIVAVILVISQNYSRTYILFHFVQVFVENVPSYNKLQVLVF